MVKKARTKAQKRAVSLVAHSPNSRSSNRFMAYPLFCYGWTREIIQLSHQIRTFRNKSNHY